MLPREIIDLIIKAVHHSDMAAHVERELATGLLMQIAALMRQSGNYASHMAPTILRSNPEFQTLSMVDQENIQKVILDVIENKVSIQFSRQENDPSLRTFIPQRETGLNQLRLVSKAMNIMIPRDMESIAYIAQISGSADEYEEAFKRLGRLRDEPSSRTSGLDGTLHPTSERSRALLALAGRIGTLKSAGPEVHILLFREFVPRLNDPLVYRHLDGTNGDVDLHAMPTLYAEELQDRLGAMGEMDSVATGAAMHRALTQRLPDDQRQPVIERLEREVVPLTPDPLASLGEMHRSMSQEPTLSGRVSVLSGMASLATQTEGIAEKYRLIEAAADELTQKAETYIGRPEMTQIVSLLLDAMPEAPERPRLTQGVWNPAETNSPDRFPEDQLELPDRQQREELEQEREDVKERDDFRLLAAPWFKTASALLGVLSQHADHVRSPPERLASIRSRHGEIGWDLPTQTTR